jgi:hypothetical protein
MADATAAVVDVPTPAAVGVIVDAAPVVIEGRPVWLVLGEAGQIGRWDLSDGSYRELGTATVPRKRAGSRGTAASRLGGCMPAPTGHSPPWSTTTAASAR